MSSSLGKRKEREDEVAKSHGSTLFVSNLPYTATSTDLQTLFSDIAPVRSAFVVTESGTGVSKGVGYVSFSLKEDAQAAFDKISADGLNLVGRNLRIQWAENKPKEGEKTQHKVKKEPATPRSQFVKPPNDPLAIRTIIVSGIPSTIDSKVLWKKFRKYEGAEKVDWPIEVSGQADTAHVLFSTPQKALDAVNKLHAHVFKGNLLSVGLKKRLDNLQKPSGSGQKTHSTAVPTRAARLIIRNIPFRTTEQDLRAVFLPYGPIYSIHIPTEKTEKQDDQNESKPNISRTRGFAFVWMMSKKDAERAMEGCNGTAIRAGMAENMIGDKQKRKKQKRVEKKMKEGMKKEKAEEEAEAEGEDEDHDEDVEERTIAVDWALSKDKWEEEKTKIMAKGEEDVEMEDASSGSGSDSGSSEDESESKSNDGDEVEDGIGVHDGDESESDSENSDLDEEEHDSDATPVKPELPTPDAGTTLFVRNVPFTATEDELRTLFRTFGPLRYARITMDPETGRSRGTGFACFWNKEDADKVIEQSDLLKSETGLTEAPKQNPFKLPSILTPDPSSSLARSLVLQGRTLDVVRAVTRDKAGKLKEEGEKRREKADKRNVYLLREGVILPSSPAAETLTPAELERRSSSFNARKVLLKSNPSLYISKTRLSIRQIPTFVTERLLRRLSIHAVKTFNAEVKSRERKGLTEDELHVQVDENGDGGDGDDKNEEGTKGKNKKRFDRKTGVLQAKLVRQKERVDPVTGKGRSKGYGFIEMYTHADALRVLRWSNNNPQVGGLFEGWWQEELSSILKSEKAKPDKDGDRIKRIEKEIEKGEGVGGGDLKKAKGRLIVEFSIENVQVVQRRKSMQEEHKKTGPSGKPDSRKEKAKAKAEKEDLLKKEKEESVSALSPKKKRKLSRGSESGKEEGAGEVKTKPKLGESAGFFIGRKRKERKMGKKN